jgi:hypothetical protein
MKDELRLRGEEGNDVRVDPALQIKRAAQSGLLLLKKEAT